MLKTSILRHLQKTLGFVHCFVEILLKFDLKIYIFGSFFGINVQHIDKWTARTMGILSIKIIISVMMWNCLRTTIYAAEDLESSNAMIKPLFRLLIEFYSVSISIFYIIIIIHYFINGFQIIQLLDYYHSLYNEKVMKRKILFIITLFHAVVLIGFIQFPYDMFTIPKALMTIYSIYILSIYDYLVWSIVVYYKYGTYQMLDKLRQNIQNKSMEISVQKTSKQIQSLALQNQKLNNIISIIVLIYLFLNGAYFTIVSAMFMSDMNNKKNYDTVLYMSMIFAFLLFTVHFTMKIDHLLQLINGILSEHYQKNILLNTLTNDINAGKILFQISLYRRHFNLNLFDCIVVNYNFILCYLLFLMSNVVIIIQTN